MKKRFLLIALLSSTFILSSCSNPVDPNPPIDDPNGNQTELSFEIKIVGEGSVKAYLNGVEITPENFSENVETGDVITLVIQPSSGYILSNVLLNDTVLARNGSTYTFTVQEGKNVLTVNFTEVTTNETDFSYEILNDNEVAITDFENSLSTMPNPVIIPDEATINGKTYKVTTLNSSVFSNQDIVGLKIGKNVTTINSQAFNGMRSLQEFIVDDENLYFKSLDGILYDYDETSLVKMPIAYKDKSVNVQEGTIEILDYAFNDCLNTTSVTLPEGLISIGDYAFTDATNLSTINFPSTLESIGDYAFRNIHAIKNVVLDESLTHLGVGAFYQSSIESVTFPSSLKEIPLYSFYFCRSLETVIFNEGLKIIGEQSFISTSVTSLDFPNSLKTIDKSAFELCSYLINVQFNEGLETIGNFAFSRANNITSISLPASLTTIGYNPFSGITRLGYEDNFKVDSNNPNFEVIDGVLYTKGAERRLLCYPFGKIGTEYHIIDGTTYIDVDSFAYQNNVLEIYLPTSITDINSAFRVMYSEMDEKPSLTLYYAGTMEEFKKINLHGELGSWHEDTTLTNSEVICSDGALSVN